MTKTIALYTAGTGAVHSVPSWGCNCGVCSRARIQPQFARSPCSAVLKISDGDKPQYILIDAGQTDIMQRYNRRDIWAFVLTHFHADHVQGLLPIRWHGHTKIPVYCVHDTNGYGDLLDNKGSLEYTTVTPFESFFIQDIQFTPVPLNHPMPTIGYVITYNNTTIAYLCDTKGLPFETESYLQSLHLNTVILDCTHASNKTSQGHGNLTDAEYIHKMLQPKNMFLTHIEHNFDIWLDQNKIPNFLQVAQDNQFICKF